MTLAEQVIAQARTWLNVRWRHQGRDRNGVDCVGLFAVISQELGLFPHVTDITNYSHVPDTTLMLQLLDENLDRIELESIRPGDIVLMQFDGRAQHLGLITDKGLLHSAALYRKVVEHGINKEWRLRMVRAWRLRSVTG